MSDVLIASDASAKGVVAAFGGVLIFPDGTRVEVSGPLPRSDHQEVTAALATLRYLPAGVGATLQVDAQDDVLRASLCITHPQVRVTRVPRNSSVTHERAHELARGALKALEATGPAPLIGEPRIGVFAHQTLDAPEVRFGVAYWLNGAIQQRAGCVSAQATRRLTLQVLQEEAQASVPVGFMVVESRFATNRHARPEWQATGEQLTALRRASEAALHGDQAAGDKSAETV